MSVGSSLITTIFCDVGGVLLSNAWDHEERHEVLPRFGLNEADFAARHEKLVVPFETGALSLDDYLDQTVFYTSRAFTREDFKQAMFPLSQPRSDALKLVRALAGSGKYFMATLNNESREFNDYRIQTFRLREIFSLFVSSCYVGLRKPDEPIYRLALELTQKSAGECCFIDDRAPNLEAPAKLGMMVIQAKDADQLRRDLQALGITP